MSMISELVERLRSFGSGFDDAHVPLRLLNSAADSIEELSTKLHNSQMERSSQHYNGGWIPCSERLSEKKVGEMQEDVR